MISRDYVRLRYGDNEVLWACDAEPEAPLPGGTMLGNVQIHSGADVLLPHSYIGFNEPYWGEKYRRLIGTNVIGGIEILIAVEKWEQEEPQFPEGFVVKDFGVIVVSGDFPKSSVWMYAAEDIHESEHEILSRY